MVFCEQAPDQQTVYRHRRNMRKEIVGLVGAASISVALLGTASAAGAATTGVTSVGSAQSASVSKVNGSIKRSEVIARAKYWLGKGIRYNMNGHHRDPQGRQYRTDCSGYVSMALHLGSSLSTVTLPGVGHKISKRSLKEGDFIGHLGPGTGGAGGHVRLFEKWANSAHTLYWAYDFGSTPVKHQIYKLSTPSNYTAYEYKKIKNG
jgi:hypothetical protein